MSVSIHAPREGERLLSEPDGWVQVEFQSTLPARGSDPAGLALQKQHPEFQSTLPARGSDEVKRNPMWVWDEFQSTLPARGSD